MLSDRVNAVVPFLAMDVLARARRLEREGRSIIHFEVGEPDYPSPAGVKAAAIRAIEDDVTHYTAARGEHRLVEAIAASYKRHGVTVAPEQVIVSAGTSPVLLMAFLAIVNPGDEVIVPRPYYACYPNFVRLAGGTPVFVDTRPEDGFKLQAAAVAAAITPRTRAVLLASPANPTGAVLDRASLQAIADLGVTIISDEIYHGLTYEGDEVTALACTSDALVVNGFSKAYAMTGWRLGYIVVPPAYARAVEVLQQTIIISANSFVQAAGLAALTDPSVQDELARMKAGFAERRKIMLEGVRELGLGVPKVPPTGAFYVLADARHVDADSMRLAARILDDTGVALTPGDDFGAPGFLRFSYTAEPALIREGLARLKKVFS